MTDFSKLLAHTKGDLLIDHLKDVAEIAQCFAKKFDCGILAYWLGIGRAVDCQRCRPDTPTKAILRARSVDWIRSLWLSRAVPLGCAVWRDCCHLFPGAGMVFYAVLDYRRFHRYAMAARSPDFRCTGAVQLVPYRVTILSLRFDRLSRDQRHSGMSRFPIWTPIL